MSSAPAFRMDFDDDDLVIRVPRDAVSPEKASRCFDYLLLESGSRELKLSEEEVEAIANEADKAAWERIRPMVEEKVRGR